MVGAGRLNKKITIQRATATRDAAGAEVRTWATLQYAWAAIEPLSGRETEIAHAIEATRTHKILLRTIDGAIKSSDRILYCSKIYEITSPIIADISGEFVTVYVSELES